MNPPHTGTHDSASPESGAPDPARLKVARDAMAAATVAADASKPVADADETTTTRRRRQRSTTDENARADADAVDSGGSEPNGMARGRQIALRQLAMGPRTRQQLSDRMRDRECSPEVIERVLERMSDVGLVNDEAYAQMLVRTKRQGSGLAIRGLRHELRKKGVPEHLAEAAVAEVRPAEERAQAEALVAARLRRLHGLDRDVQMRRLGGFLARKGYPAGLSFAVIRDALDQAPEQLRD